MKKCFKLFIATAATLVAAASCQKVEEIFEAPKKTHTVKFTTELPAKTSYEVEGAAVNYKWEESDLDRLHVYEDELEGTIIVDDSAIDETYVMLTVAFEGEEGGSHIYTADLNGGIVKSEQVADGKYDSDCDVLVAKPVSSDEITEGYYTFRFRRPVAITELKLKNLKEGEEVSKVTIISDADHPLIGKYTQGTDDHTTGEWGETSNKIVVTFGTEQDGETPKTKTVAGDGSLIVPIVSMPVESASVKVLVETESGLKYRKVTSAALTLTANNVKVQGIGLNQVSEAEHAEAGWYLVTDASELFDGDEIRIACPSKGMIAGEFAVVSEETKEYLSANTATFTPETYAQLTGVDSENMPNTFKLVENYGSFALVNENGKLGATSAKKMSYDDGTGSYSGVTDWTIAIDDNSLASIEVGDKGRIQCNVTYSRFLNYTSEPQSNQLLPQIYKKYGAAEDPIIKTARTASFSPETATVTIDADDNVYPELSFEPVEATGGEQSWTSSNTEVATVDATTGEVTLVSDGTTTIKVEIAESDTYQPCSAEYELTVKPAEVEGVDYLDRAWTGISDGSVSYSSWTGKTGSKSGNTYAGNSAGSNNSIQLRAKDNSGIVVTATNGGKLASNVTIDWNSNTTTGRSIKIFGKNTAYESAADLYDNTKKGTEIGTIGRNESTLSIDGDYEYIGILAVGGAVYLNSISIQWEDPKPSREGLGFYLNDTRVTTPLSATVGDSFTAPVLKDNNGPVMLLGIEYQSSDCDVVEVNSSTGMPTIKQKGTATITATVPATAEYAAGETSYTINVANKLSSIKLADDSAQPTTFYVGQDFSFAGIKLEAEYNDGEKKTLTSDDLTAENFSGFDSSAAVEKQAITVSYTDGVTETTSYDIEIKPLVTLYGITVPAADANGNSITVKGGLTEAAEGDEIEIDVNLNSGKGYKLTSLKVNEVEHSADVTDGKYTFTMPAEAITVTASFDNHYNVVLGSATNGSFTVNSESSSPVSVEYGTTVNLAATPATGYVFKKWTVEGAIVASATAATTSFTMPAGEVTVNAMFTEPLPTIVIDLNASGATGSYSDPTFSVGVVSFSAKQWMKSTNFIQAKANMDPSVQNTSEIPGIIKSITVVTGSGKTARAVTVYGGTSSASLTDQITSPTTAMTMVFDFSGKSYSYFKLATPGNACYFDNITIEYDPSGYTPTNYSVSIANDIPNGSVSATPTSATAGTEITLTATPDDGYSFGSWDVKDASDNPITVTDNKFKMPASNVTVSATFTQGSTSGDTYVLCTSTSDLVAGADYIIANGTSGSVNCISTESNSSNRKVVGATVVNSTIDVSSTPTIMVLTLGGSTGAWTLYTKNYAGTKGYLASASSGNYNYCRVISSSTTCTISFLNNAAVITLQPHTSRNILRYNSSSSLFACYSSGQDAVYLYKKSN